MYVYMYIASHLSFLSMTLFLTTKDALKPVETWQSFLPETDPVYMSVAEGTGIEAGRTPLYPEVRNQPMTPTPQQGCW